MPLKTDDRYFVDCHTHVLPGMDDGAADADVSRQMLASLADQGTAEIWLTSHYYPQREALDDYVAKRRAAYEKIAHLFPEYGIRARLGAEVFFSGDLFYFEPAEFRRLTIDGSHWLLLELPYRTPLSDELFDAITRVKEISGCEIILAHIERYNIHINRAFRQRLLDAGLRLQMNLSDYARATAQEQALLETQIADGDISFLATDCHNMDRRKPVITPLLSRITDRVGVEPVREAIAFSRRVIAEDLGENK